MAAIDTLRTNQQAALVALRGDDSGMTPTQSAAANQFNADVALEIAGPRAAVMRTQESIASGLPAQIRSGQANVPDINSALAISVAQNVAMSTYTITATQTPTLFSAAPLPAGLAINTATGAITGTPTAPKGTYGVFITATKAGKTSSTKRLVITIT